MGNLLVNYFNQTENEDPSEEEVSGERGSTTSSSEVQIMCCRVKEVLPQVPIDVIRRDLRITGDVDETITRLLDGTVKYTPQTATTPSSQSESTDETSGTPVPSLSTAASSFGKDSRERMKSLEERKKLLIQASRTRYLAKHKN